MPYERKKVEIFTIEARNRILVTYFTFQYALVAEMVNALVKDRQRELVAMILLVTATTRLESLWLNAIRFKHVQIYQPGERSPTLPANLSTYYYL